MGITVNEPMKRNSQKFWKKREKKIRKKRKRNKIWPIFYFLIFKDKPVISHNREVVAPILQQWG